MKTKATIKHILLALTIVLSIASCKKDKKTDPTPTPVEVKAMTLTDLKALSTGASVKVPENTKITGIVISDVSNKNIDNKTVILQEAIDKPGIIITFDAAQTFALNDEIEVNISGQTLAQVNGEIQLTNVPAANAKKNGTGSLTAKATTAAAIATNKAAWDGTLVSIAATALDGGNGKYTGSLTITDASGTVNSTVLAGASFNNTAYPLSVSAITGIVRVSGDQVSVDIRKTTDVSTGDITRVITEDFTNVTDPAPSTPDAPKPESFLNFGFSTAAGGWNVNGNSKTWLFPGSKFDADFTTGGRSYVYLGSSTALTDITDGVNYQNFLDNQMITNFTKLAGVKQISVTFAGSKVSGKEVLPFSSAAPWDPIGTPAYSVDVAAFNPATDYFQIGINLLIYNNTTGAPIIMPTSPKYTDMGQFHTFTWAVPTKEQMVAAGVSADAADVWLANPIFSIVNLSTRKADPTSSAPNHNVYAPILFDKVVFGFGN